MEVGKKKWQLGWVSIWKFGMKWQLGWVSLWKWYELAIARCTSVLLKFANFQKFSLSSLSFFLFFSSMVFGCIGKLGIWKLHL
jgi:hypothetical protein